MRSEEGPLAACRDSPSRESGTTNSRNKRHICPECGIYVNSAESLKVHMQYQHENMSRWSAPTTVQTASSGSITTTSQSQLTTTLSNNVSDTAGTGNSGNITNQSAKSPTDSDNNNHQKSKLHSDVPPLHNNASSANTNSTVSAAADSSNNQSPTPGASAAEQGQSQGYNTSASSNSSSYQQGNNLLPPEMHAYNPYIGYEQFYPPPHMDTSMYPMPYQTGTEYKSVPSNRYHPYHNSNSHVHQTNQVVTTNGGTNVASSSASNSSLSPRVVSSSSPTQNSIIVHTGNQDSTNAMTHIPQGQPTPSPSPKQCDKCGYVCQTDTQLSDHYTSAHGMQQNDGNNRTAGNGDDNEMQNQYSYQPYIKEEPSSDILDLDSQKMVYPPAPHEAVNQEALPSMHSIHPMHRSSLMWGSEMHSGYMPHSQSDIKQPYYPPMRPPYPGVKQEFPNIKQEYGATAGFGAQVIKSEFNAHHQPILPQTRPDMKPFSADITTASNPATSSPSEFPSTTTPQDNGSQFRGFEPPTSSLPNNTSSTKSATWKSNEARRPKTYNCTACNKWFTSSGHLKRHYNTTLHKNAVKSSGQPDPATLPISAHHHPSRDPNSKHHRNNQSQQPPPAPPEPPRSPEYTPQYTPPPGGFTQSTGTFQQYNPSPVSMHSNGHPNGQAGPSVHASQQRDLLIISNTEAMCSQQSVDRSLQQQREDQYQQILEQINPDQQLQQQGTHIILTPHMSGQQDTTSTPTIIHNTMEPQYLINHIAPITTSPSITQSYQRMLPAEGQQNLHTITGNDSHLATNPDNLQMMNPIAYETTGHGHQHDNNLQITTIHQIQTVDGQQISHISTLNPSIVELHRLSGGQHSIVYPQTVPESVPRSPPAADSPPNQKGGTDTSLPPMTLIIPISPDHQHQMMDNNFTNNMDNGSVSAGSPNSTTSSLMYPISPPQMMETNGGGGGGSVNNNHINNSLNSSNMSTSSVSPTPSMASTSSAKSTTSSPSTRVECRQCGKEFAKACYLTQHNKTFHSGVQPFRCPKCGKRFQSRETFDIHLDKHVAIDKPFKCDTCPKQFHHKTDLRRHIDGHKGYKAHVCETCSKGFCRKDHLRKHCDTHKPKTVKKAVAKASSTPFVP